MRSLCPWNIGRRPRLCALKPHGGKNAVDPKTAIRSDVTSVEHACIRLPWLGIDAAHCPGVQPALSIRSDPYRAISAAGANHVTSDPVQSPVFLLRSILMPRLQANNCGNLTAFALCVNSFVQHAPYSNKR